MLEVGHDELPNRWRSAWHSMDSAAPAEMDNCTLQEWLEQMYFDDVKRVDFTRRDIAKVGELVRRMLRFEPGERALAREILEDAWFEEE